MNAEEFDGCSRRCRKQEAHCLKWPDCALAPQPEPTISIGPRHFTASDGCPSMGFDTYTVQELADRIESVLFEYVDGYQEMAMAVARFLFDGEPTVDTTDEQR